MDKGRSGGHSANPTKPPHNPARDMHPGAKMTTQAAVKRDPCVKGKGK